MAPITQLQPGAWGGRRYGSFAGKPEGAAAEHPVGVLTQLQLGGWGGKRYGSFAGRAEVVVVEGGLSLAAIFAHYYRRRRMGTNMERAQKRLACTPLLDTGGAYTSGDLMGTKATLQITNATLTQAPGAGTVLEINISDKDNQKPACTLVFFAADPAATTFTDQAPFDIHDSDLEKATFIPITSDDWVSFADNAVCRKDTLLDFVLTDTMTLQLALVSRGTPTFSNADAMTITLLILQAT